MIQPEADQLELALRLAKELADVLAKLEKSPNLTIESRMGIHGIARGVDVALKHWQGHWSIESILERAREQSSGQV